MEKYPTPLASSLRDVRAGIVFRFVCGTVGGLGFYFFHDRLPYPHPAMALLCVAALLYNCLLIPTLWIRDVRKHYLLHEWPGYLDVGFSVAAIHLTGGYLSPFSITPLLTIWGMSAAYLPDRVASTRLFVTFMAALIGMTVLHKTGLVPVPVDYAARLMKSDPFFYTTFLLSLFTFSLAFLLVTSTSQSVRRLFEDFLETNRSIIGTMAPVPVGDPLPLLASALSAASGGRRVLIARANRDQDRPIEFAGTFGCPSVSSDCELLAESPTVKRLARGAALKIRDVQAEPEPDPVLGALGVRGFWGSSLEPGQASSVGLVCLLDEQPLWFDPKTELVSQLVLVLARAELYRQRHEKEQTELRERLHQSEKMEALGQLAGGVAHDFNNLLTVILGNAELLSTSAPEKPEEEVRQIADAASQAADLASQLLTFSRAKSLAQRPVGVNALVVRVVELLRRTLDRRIFVETKLDAEGYSIIGDGSQLQTALLNVAVNARDAMPEGGKLRFETRIVEVEAGSVEVRSGALRPGPHACLSCRDTGVGMAAAVLERALEPFFTTKPPGKGTGLGLASVYGIASHHGGTVQLHSIVGEGTTVTLFLPARQAEPDSFRQSARPARNSRSGRVLLVDDEPAVLEATRRLLQFLGFEVEAMVDAELALARFEANAAAIDLLVLDVMMPKTSGLALYERMRASKPDQVCLFVTGYADLPGLAELEARPECAILPKPFRAAELEASLEGLLGRSTSKGSVS